jgi:TldD protein
VKSIRAEHFLGKFNADYIELRQSRAFSTKISLRDKEKSISSGEQSGLSVRMLVKGSWGFASTDDLSKAEDAFNRAYKLAKLSKGSSRVESSPVYSGKSKTIVKQSFEGIPIEQKMKDMQGLQKLLSGNSISSTALAYSDSVSSELFLNSEGSEISQETSVIYVSFTSVAKSGSLMQRASERIGKSAGYEVVKECYPLAGECPTRAKALLSASAPPPGTHTVVIDGRMTGLLCHEALGHACEADSILAGSSILKGKMGGQIGSPLVTIYDDPTMQGAFGSFGYDDEGVKAQKKFLVKNGKLAGYLHSRETASKLKMKPTGNARAQSYAYVPIVRMSNTCMERGHSKVEKLFQDVKLGVYARGMNGGCVDPATGYFVFGAEDGYLIENGEKTKLLRDVLLSGTVLQALKNIEMVASDFLGSPGVCGKGGQGVPVSDGGPHVRARGITVGGKA